MLTSPLRLIYSASWKSADTLPPHICAFYQLSAAPHSHDWKETTEQEEAQSSLPTSFRPETMFLRSAIRSVRNWLRHTTHKFKETTGRADAQGGVIARCYIFASQYALTPAASSTLLLAARMARNGYIGTAPLNPELAISIESLRLYHRLASRCPRLSIQAFVRTLCDLHCVSQKVLDGVQSDNKHNR